jgi:NAD(P)-dependent dehydrogenase (short-subunit alcohol dehydrogenase family)
MDSDGPWTVARMPDLDGKTVVVTGANSGVGLAATRAFVLKGAHVVMACRSRERGEQARESVLDEFPRGSAEVAYLDLADLESVESFATEVTDTHDRLDVLCNNAGVMALPRSETTDGFETQFGVNHLGHFALTGHLLETLAATPGETRVVTQSSGVHERGRIDFEDPMGVRSYDRWDAYAQSKLANVLFAYELQARLEAAGLADVTSLACHPGWAATNLQFRGSEGGSNLLRTTAMRVANALFAQSADRGALPMLYAATAPGLEGGEYVGPGGLMSARGYPTVQRSSPRSYDRSIAGRLWTLSESLTGVSYEFEALPDAEADEAAGADAGDREATGEREPGPVDA